VGEGFDRAELGPPGVQEDLVKAIAAAGKPTIVVMVQGRAFSVPWIKEHVPAILGAFYPGEEGGTAIAGILFGRINPSGRLPVSIPQSVGHIPTTYGLSAARADSLRLLDRRSALVVRLRAELYELRICGPQDRNAGDRDFGRGAIQLHRFKHRSARGREVAQVYYHEDVTSVATPMKRLIRFQKVDLKPGEKRRIEFSIPAAELAVWNADMKHVVEPGTIELMVGPAAEDGFIKLRGKFQVR